MRGFTLIELLVVMAVLGLLAAIPASYASSNAARLDAAMLALVADLEAARDEALSSGEQRTVVLGWNGASTYQLYAGGSLSNNSPPLWRRALHAGRWVRLELRTPAQIVFDIDGAISSGGLVEVKLGEQRRILRMHEASGTLWVMRP